MAEVKLKGKFDFRKSIGANLAQVFLGKEGRLELSVHDVIVDGGGSLELETNIGVEPGWVFISTNHRINCSGAWKMNLLYISRKKRKLVVSAGTFLQLEIPHPSTKQLETMFDTLITRAIYTVDTKTSMRTVLSPQKVGEVVYKLAG